jgi:hypothetical protein
MTHAHSITTNMDQPTETRSPEGPARSEAFNKACGMEDPLRVIRNFAGALERVAQTLSDDIGAEIVQEISMTILARVDELDEIHSFFGRLHSPNRERFEREGWPSEQAVAEAT